MTVPASLFQVLKYFSIISPTKNTSHKVLTIVFQNLLFLRYLPYSCSYSSKSKLNTVNTETVLIHQYLNTNQMPSYYMHKTSVK